MITAMMTAGGAGLVFLVIYLAALVLALVASTKILSKAGYSGWWVLIAFVPVANFVMFLVFAFSDWPALRSRSTPVDPSWAFASALSGCPLDSPRLARKC